MAQPTLTDLRELILKVAQQQEPQNYMGPTLQQGSVLDAVAQHLGVRQNPDLEQAILTQWHDLFRTGYFA